MPSSDPKKLSDVHAIMDEVDALQAQRSLRRDPDELIRQVTDTYRNLGVDVDPALISQAVAVRMGDTHPAPFITVPFDFGWKRPAHPHAWQTQLRRRARVTSAMKLTLGWGSSVAFWAWLWIIFGTVPDWADHPWLFAFACMGAGSVLETMIKHRKKRDRQLENAKVRPRSKQMARWQASDRARDHLAQVVISQVPLLKADVAQLDRLAAHDAEMTLVKNGLADPPQGHPRPNG